MMRYVLPRLILLFIALSLNACVPEESTPVLVDPTDFVTFAHPTGVFTLNLPPEWVVTDTSDDVSLNVEFSPPNSPEPLIGVYAITLDAMDAVPALPTTPDPSGTPETPTVDLDALATSYEMSYYTFTDATFKEIAREQQPDGSIRIKFLIDSPQGTTQHNDFVQVVGSYFVAMRIRIPEDTAQMRTLSRVVNTLEVNESAGWVSLVQADQSANRDVVGFASLNTWVDRSGGFEIAGQVVNNAPQALEFVRITAQFYDENNNQLAEQDDFVSSDMVLPGEYAPFSLVFSDGLPPGTVRYDLNASARYADYAARTFYGLENFDLTSEAGFDDNGLLVVQGQVRNKGTQTANLVKVIVTVFDEYQRVIATDTTLVDVQRLAPGEISTYAVSFVEVGGTPNTFVVSAQGITE
jgi:hypothetical protein